MMLGCRGRKLQRFLFLCLFIVTCVLLYTSLRHAPPVLEEGRHQKQTAWEENEQQVMRRGVRPQEKVGRNAQTPVDSKSDSEGRLRTKRTDEPSQSDETPDIDLQQLGYCKVDVAILNVWPLPQSLLMVPQDVPVGLRADFSVITLSKSSVLQDGIKRYRQTLHSLATVRRESPCGSPGGDISKVYVKVKDDNEELSLATSYDYSVTVEASVGVVVRADSPYGALYGLETMSQLFSNGCLEHSHVHIEDHPDYRHRGFMLDTGRRFVPKELLLNFLDAMSYLKMNVFHWHLSDFCIFSIESKVFPELTSHLESGRYYTQEDAKEVVQYAKNRGIRVIPEIDLPGHAKGFQHLKNSGLQFCDDSMKQIYNDPAGQTWSVLQRLIQELSGLFPDQYFHIGCDETSQVRQCNLRNIRDLEEKAAESLLRLGKIPVGWEEALFTTGVNVPGMVIQGWFSHSATEIAGKGHPAIESNIEHYYLDYVERDYRTVWSGAIGSLSDQLILGGEFAMWGDMWIANRQCWDEPNWQWLPRAPVVYWMHDKEHDKVFMDSLAGLVWPRGVVAAGRFWHYVADLQLEELTRRVDHENEVMISRGVYSCPVKCHCDYLKRCGQDYPR